MAAEFDFISGVDPTSLTEITGAQLKQLVDNAAPDNFKGLIIAQTATPDVASNPRYSRFLWLDLNGILADGNAPYTLKYYNPDTPAWEPVDFGIIDGDRIEAGTINPLAALSGAGLADNLILITNAESWALTTLAAALSDGSISLAKLEEGNEVKDVMMWNGSAWAITQISYGDISTADGAIAAEKIEAPTASSYLLVPDPDNDLKPTWMAITDVITRNFILYPLASDPLPWTYIDKLPANHLPIVSSDGNSWESLDKNSLPGTSVVKVITYDFDTFVNLTIGDSSIKAFTNTLGSVPDIFSIKLRCKTTFDDGTLAYDEGDTVSSSSLQALGSPNSFELFQLQFSSDTVYLNGYLDSSIYNIKKKNDSDWVNLNPNYYQYFDIVITLVKFN